MKIKKLIVRSLYDELNFEWEFDDKVNILAGINGSYKTTLLNIIRQLTDHEEIGYPVSSVEAEYSEGIKLTYTRQVRDVKTLVANREDNKYIVEMIEKEHPEWISGGDPTPNVQISIVSYREEKDGQRLDKNVYEAIKKIDFISTFDVATMRDKTSVLDSTLATLKEQYSFYLNDLNNQLSTLFKANNSVSIDQVNEINRYRDEFVKLVNENFADTGKKLSETESNLNFVMEDGQVIQPTKLSAGEKQLLIILLTVLLEKRQEYILVMDEPEISMHIDMQYNLIDNLLKLNPALQLIISTHAPAIFGSGWGDKVVQANELPQM